jgi:hypothetical protein
VIILGQFRALRPSATCGRTKRTGADVVRTNPIGTVDLYFREQPRCDRIRVATRWCTVYSLERRLCQNGTRQGAAPEPLQTILSVTGRARRAGGRKHWSSHALLEQKQSGAVISRMWTTLPTIGRITDHTGGGAPGGGGGTQPNTPALQAQGVGPIRTGFHDHQPRNGFQQGRHPARMK